MRDFLESEDFTNYTEKLIEELNNIIMQFEKSGSHEGWKASLDMALRVLKVPFKIIKSDNVKQNTLKAMAKFESKRITSKISGNINVD